MKIAKPKLTRRTKLFIAVLLLLVILVIAGVFIYRTWLSNNYFVSVNGTKITLEEKQAEINSLITFYEYNNQSYDGSTIEQTIENNLINSLLLQQYAEANGITVSDQDLQSYYDQRANSAGGEQELLNKVKELYGYDKNTYLLSIKETILRDELQKRIDKPLSEWLAEQKNQADIIYY